MGPLDFIGNKLKDFGSDVEGVADSAVNDVKNAVGSLFSSGSPTATATRPTQPSAPPQAPSPLGIQNTNQAQNPALKVNFNPNAPTDAVKNPGVLPTFNPTGAPASLAHIQKQVTPTNLVSGNLKVALPKGTQSSVDPIQALTGALKGTAMLPINTVQGAITLPLKAQYQSLIEHNPTAANATELEAGQKSAQGFGGAAAIPAYFLAKPIANLTNPLNVKAQTQANLQNIGITPNEPGGQRAFQLAGQASGSLAPLGAAASGAKFLTPSNAIKLAGFSNVIEGVKSGSLDVPSAVSALNHLGSIAIPPPSVPESTTPSEEDIVPRNADAERAAAEEYQRSGDFDRAATAYQSVSGTDSMAATTGTARALQEIGQISGQGEASPYGIEALPGLSDEEAAKGGITSELPDRAKVTSPASILKRLGPASRQILQIFRNKEGIADQLTAAMRSETPTFRSLSEDDQNLAADVVRGRETSDRPEINQAAQELQSHFSSAYKAAGSAGLDVGNRGLSYIPQMLRSNFLDKTANFNKAVQNLLDNGRAPDKATAVKTVNAMRNTTRSSPSRFGHFEAREFDFPTNFTTKELDAYDRGAANRTAEAQHYGPNNEEINKLVAKAGENGEDVTQLNKIVQDYTHPEPSSTGTASKISRGVRGVTNVALLPKAALSHAGQGIANTASDVGYTKFFKALGNKIFTSKENDFLERSGAKEIGKEETSTSKLDKVTAPGLKQELSFWRQIAHIGGKYNAQSLAGKADEAGLRKIGVTGDLNVAEDGKIHLSEAQQIQAGRAESNKSIFSTSSLETPKFLKSEVGKALGEFRTAYSSKESGFIVNLVKDARHGNPAPLLRYLAVGLPASGVGVTLLKNTYTSGTPIKKGQSLGNFAASALSNSGGLSLGAGLADSAVNAARYNYNNADRAQNAAGAVAPGLGIATELGQNIDTALRGNKTPLVKQGAGAIPLPLVGSKIDQKFAPVKVVSPAQQQFLKAWGNGRNQINKELSPAFGQSANATAIKESQRIKDIANTFLDKDHTSDGKSILLNSYQKAENYGNLASDPKALSAVQNFEKTLPGHNPIWNLPTNKLQTYLGYESLAPGDPNRTVLEQKNPWLTGVFNQESGWAAKQTGANNSAPGQGYVAYPNISPAQNQMMSQVTQLAAIQNRSTAQETQLTTLEDNPQLQSAYAALDKYTNQERANWPGLQPIPYPVQNLTPQQESLLSQESALPSGTGAKSSFIKANQDEWNQVQQILAQNTIYDVEKQGGVIQQGGTEPDFLKDTYEAGQYDIAPKQNADGTTSYSLNPAAAYAASQAASSSKDDPLIAFPPRLKGKRLKVKRAPKFKAKGAKLAKSQKTLKVTPAHTLTPTQVLRPTQVVKLKP